MIEIADQQQREQALDSGRSFIVQAPAGSGKTSLLIQRYLILLAKVHKVPEEILAITFTRKAASEMRMRIRAALCDASSQSAPQDSHKLKIWQLAKQVLERDRKSNWNLLDNLNRLSIYTIDGLCHSLVKQMPILSGLGVSFDIVQNHDATECYRKAVHSLLISIEDELPYKEALKNLLLHLDTDYQKIENLLTDMLARRDQWFPYIINNQNFETAITNIINENLENCKISIPPKLLKELFTFAESHIPEFNNSSEIIKWQKIAKLLLTQNYEWRKTIDKRQNLESLDKRTKQQILDLIKKLHQYEDVREDLQAVLVSPTQNTQKQVIINSLTEVLKVLAAYHLRLVFRKQKEVDYIEIALASLKALGEEDNPTDLTLKMDYKIQHILVDEFQDTSVTQYELLKKLTAGWQPDDGRTLFLVGDPMQSIYKFREAKVGLFLRARRYGINSIKLYPLTLSSNFRSDKYLIDWVNRVFPKILPCNEKISLGAIPFIPATVVHNNKDRLKVDTHFFPNKDYQSEAQQIVEIIQQTKSVNSCETIAILVRSRSHLKYIIPALREAGLSYKGIELETIGESSTVQDLFSLTKVLLNQHHDRIAWLSILRAPWCGLTLADLHLIAKQNHDMHLWHVIEKYQELSELSADGKNRLQNLVSVLSHSLRNLYSKNIRRLVEETWLALNGHLCLPNETELNNAQSYFNLLSETYIENLNLLETKIKTLYAEPDSNSDNNLQIMTIHKAKGLEFDTVIIPGLNHRLQIDRDPLLMWDERPSSRDNNDTNLILAPIGDVGESPNPVYNYLRYEDKRKNHYEEGRLLYVAITRAKKALHLLGCVDKKPISGSLLEQLSSGVLVETIKSPLVTNLHFNQSKPQLRKISRLPANKFTKDFLNQEQIQPSQSYILNLPDNALKNIGIVIHNYLSNLSNINLNNWLEQNLKQQREIWEKQLIQLGINNNLAKNINIIENAIKTTLHDPRGKWILNKNHQDAQSEYQVTLTENNKTQHLIIDRTFIDKSIRWIIDYKTSTFNDNDLNIKDFLNQQFHEHRNQLETYAKVMHHLDNRPIRLGLYFPMFAGWYEWS